MRLRPLCCTLVAILGLGLSACGSDEAPPRSTPSTTTPPTVSAPPTASPTLPSTDPQPKPADPKPSRPKPTESESSRQTPATRPKPPKRPARKSQAKLASEYGSALNEIQQQFITDVGRVGLNAQDLPAFKRALDRLDPLLIAFIADLERLDPPKVVSADHERLVATLKRSQRAFADNAPRLLSADPDTQRAAVRAISAAVSDFSTSVDKTLSVINGKLVTGGRADRDTP